MFSRVLILSLYTCVSDEPAKPNKITEPDKTTIPRFTLPDQSAIPKIGFAINSRITFQLTSNVAWSVAANPTSWCSVSPAKGKGTNTAVTITVKATTANTGSSTRNCTLTFTATGVSTNPTRSVTQNSPRFDLPAQKAIQKIGYAINSTITFKLTSNVAWSVAANPTSWCSVSPAKGKGTNTAVTITVKATTANTSTTSVRNCTLTFTATGVRPNPTRSVTQNSLRFDLPDQKAIPRISRLANSTISFQLTSNVAWSVAANPTSWCSVLPASGKGTNTAVTITVTASNANTGASARNCTLTFTATGVSPSPTRSITQSNNLIYTVTVGGVLFKLMGVPAKEVFCWCE